EDLRFRSRVVLYLILADRQPVVVNEDAKEVPLGMIEAQIESGHAIALERKADDCALEWLLERQHRSVHVLFLLPAGKRSFADLKITLISDPAFGQLWAVELFLHDRLAGLANQKL